MGERLLDIGVAHRGEHCPGRGAGADGGEASLSAAVVGLDVDRGDGLDSRALPLVEVPERDEVFGQRLGFVGGPGPHAVGELVLVDQAVLEGEQSEEQVAIGVGHEVLRGKSVTCRARRQRESPGLCSDDRSQRG